MIRSLAIVTASYLPLYNPADASGIQASEL